MLMMALTSYYRTGKLGNVKLEIPRLAKRPVS